MAHEFYCEALSSYDRYDTERRRDEQDPVNAIVRYLYSTLGPSQVPMTPSIPTIDHAVEDVVVAHPERELVFDAIAHLVYRSRYATGRVLGRLYAKDTIQAWAMQYLKGKGVVPKVPI